jgi:phage tail protein X
MRLTHLLEGEDLAKVVRRMYRSEVKGGLAEAERLVIAANPQLADPAKARAGAVVLLPDVEGTKAIGDSTGTPAQAIGEALRAALDGLGDLGSVTDAAIAKQETESSGTLELLKTREVQALGSQDPEAKKRLAAIQQASNERLKGLKELRTVQKTALAEFQGDANALLAMLGGESTKG